jgi:DNA-directed RNA polymerase subunit RPC12/RpoP
MEKYNCTNCKHLFYSIEQTATIKCPVCDKEVLNASKVINTCNFLWIESMFKNIQTFGKDETFNMIDKNYSNAITRARIRKIYFQTLNILEK